MTLYAFIVWLPVACALASLIAQSITVDFRIRLVTGGVLYLALCLVKLGGLPLIGFPRALLAEPSMALVLFSILHLARSSGWAGFRALNISWLHYAAAALGLVLYPAALGLGWFDPYALGFGAWLPAAFLACGAVCWPFAGTRLIALWVMAALIAHGYGLGESDNLWDYLLDPAAVAIAMFRVIAGAVARKRHAIWPD